MLTYAFLHGSLTHLAFNMFGLWMFGAELERVWGARRMVQFYFASVLMAACSIAKADMWKVTRVNLPFIGVLVVTLLLVTYVPAIPLFLVDVFYR